VVPARDPAPGRDPPSPAAVNPATRHHLPRETLPPAIISRGSTAVELPSKGLGRHTKTQLSYLRWGWVSPPPMSSMRSRQCSRLRKPRATRRWSSMRPLTLWCAVVRAAGRDRRWVGHRRPLIPGGSAAVRSADADADADADAAADAHRQPRGRPFRIRATPPSRRPSTTTATLSHSIWHLGSRSPSASRRSCWHAPTASPPPRSRSNPPNRSIGRFRRWSRLPRRGPLRLRVPGVHRAHADPLRPSSAAAAPVRIPATCWSAGRCRPIAFLLERQLMAR
jgi:hypothetical protein